MPTGLIELLILTNTLHAQMHPPSWLPPGITLCTALMDSIISNVRNNGSTKISSMTLYQPCSLRADHLGSPHAINPPAPVSILPGGELNLPSLTPGTDSPAVKYLDQGDEHKNCNKTRCVAVERDKKTSNDYYQKHKKKLYPRPLHICGHDCKPTGAGMFPSFELCKAIGRRQLTAWTLDGRTVFGGDAYDLNKKRPFIAISHVWADGTGASDPTKTPGIQSVPSCLFSMFCKIAENLRCEGVWWDAICIPEDEKYKNYRLADQEDYKFIHLSDRIPEDDQYINYRHRSLTFMERNYSAAKYTVVHDLYLRHMPWIDAESACLALVLSSWFTRAWTALEHARSDDIYVIFAESNDPSDGYVLKNLERDILLPSREAGSACQLVTRSIIQSLRQNTRGYLSPWSPGVSYRKLQVNDVLISLKGRSTSWASDLPDVACLLAELELPPKPEKPSPNTPPGPNFCHRVLQGRAITTENLFHTTEAAEGFGWQPESFLDLPVSTRNSSSQLRISPAPPAGPPETRTVHPRISALTARHGRSDVIGSWSFICDPSPNPNFNKVRIYRPEEDKRSLKAHRRIEMAITNAMHHVILVDRNERYPSRGILVKVRRWSSGTMRPSDMEAVFGQGLRFNSFKEGVSFPCEFVGVVHFSSSELPITTAATFVMFGTDDENLARDLDPSMSAWTFIQSNVQGLNTQPLFAQEQNNVGRWSNEKPERNRWKDSANVPDVLLIPRTRTVGFAGQVNPGQGYALSGCDQIRRSDPYGLFTPAN